MAIPTNLENTERILRHLDDIHTCEVKIRVTESDKRQAQARLIDELMADELYQYITVDIRQLMLDYEGIDDEDI